MSLTRTHTILDLEVTLEAGHRAWAAYERVTGRSVLEAIEFSRLMRATTSVAMVYEFGFAMVEKWALSQGLNWQPGTWLDALPTLGSDSWNELHEKVCDLVCLSFYDKTWREMLQALDSMAAAIRGAEAA